MKTLIAYGTKYGSVAKCARLLREELRGETDLADLMEGPPPDCAPYDGVILGGSIYAGRVQKEVRAYSRANEKALLGKRLGLFLCAGAEGERGRRYLRSVFPPALYERAHCRDVFGHEVYYEKMNFFEKILMRILSGEKKSCSRLNLEAIRVFAEAFGRTEGLPGGPEKMPSPTPPAARRA
ncbi:MAG: flavodoxin domain-containing protein [Planctomycetota bacterium]